MFPHMPILSAKEIVEIELRYALVLLAGYLMLGSLFMWIGVMITGYGYSLKIMIILCALFFLLQCFRIVKLRFLKISKGFI